MIPSSPEINAHDFRATCRDRSWVVRSVASSFYSARVLTFRLPVIFICSERAAADASAARAASDRKAEEAGTFINYKLSIVPSRTCYKKVQHFEKVSISRFWGFRTKFCVSSSYETSYPCQNACVVKRLWSEMCSFWCRVMYIHVLLEALRNFMSVSSLLRGA